MTESSNRSSRVSPKNDLELVRSNHRNERFRAYQRPNPFNAYVLRLPNFALYAQERLYTHPTSRIPLRRDTLYCLVVRLPLFRRSDPLEGFIALYRDIPFNISRSPGDWTREVGGGEPPKYGFKVEVCHVVQSDFVYPCEDCVGWPFFLVPLSYTNDRASDGGVD